MIINKSRAFYEILGIQLHDKLKFSPHINNVCKSAANQLNALIRIKKCLSWDETIILINSYFMVNFNYCPLVLMSSNAVSLNKIESLQKRTLRFLYKSYKHHDTYEDLLLKSVFSLMNPKLLRTPLLKFSKL